jgi:N-6 DNA Methylase
VAGQPFYNTSKFTFSSLLGDQNNIRENVHDFVNGFSPGARDALEKFGLPRHIDKMGESEILYTVVQRFADVDLHSDKVSNLEMGYVYEELVRVTADLSNEEAGEHFTPREVIELIVNLLFADEERLLTPGRISTVHDPACGTGGCSRSTRRTLRLVRHGCGRLSRHSAVGRFRVVSPEPTWSPDGANIAFVHAGAINTIRPDGSDETTILDIGDPEVISYLGQGGGRLGVLNETRPPHSARPTGLSRALDPRPAPTP